MQGMTALQDFRKDYPGPQFARPVYLTLHDLVKFLVNSTVQAAMSNVTVCTCTLVAGWSQQKAFRQAGTIVSFSILPMRTATTLTASLMYPNLPTALIVKALNQILLFRTRLFGQL